MSRHVLILTNERDLAADDVVRRVDAAGFPVRRLNADAVVQSRVRPWSPHTAVSDVGVVWWRQFELPSNPLDRTDVDNADELLVVRAQWRAWISTLCAPGIPWVNDIWAARRAENKVEQLRSAVALGFDVPDTMLTNDREDAARFAERGAVVVKSLASGYFELSDRGFVYTTGGTAALGYPEPAWRRQPMIVQRMMPGRDVRVVAVGDQVFGASCETAAVDWRTVGAEVAWREWRVPRRLAERCSEYLAHTGLRYAAFDLRDDGTRQWFLEANQAGEWMFLERALHLGISEAVTGLLTRLAVSPA
jgi:glutathione synthase/RimK-type ligase-like ATP-grasp enzyme